MYLIAKLYEGLQNQIIDKSSKRWRLYFFEGKLPENPKNAKGAFSVMFDLGDVEYKSSGGGLKQQQAEITFRLLVAIREHETVYNRLETIDELTGWLHGLQIEGFTPIERKTFNYDDRFEYPRVFSIGFRTTAIDNSAFKKDWSTFHEPETGELEIDLEVVEELPK